MNLSEQLQQLADGTDLAPLADPVDVRRRGDRLRAAHRTRVAVAVTAAAAVAVAALVAVRQEPDPRPEPSGPIDGWQVTRTIGVPRWGAMVYADHALWVVDARDRELTDDGAPAGTAYQIDPASGRVLDRIDGAVGGWPGVGAGAIWLCTAAGGLDELLRVDLDTHEVTVSTPGRDLPHGVALAGGDLWVAETGDGDLVRTDPDTGTVLQRVPVGSSARGQAPTQPVAVGRTVWATTDDGHLVGVDAAAGQVTTRFRLGLRSPRVLATHGTTLYVTGGAGDRLVEVDVARADHPALGRELRLPSDPVGVALGLTYERGDLWLVQLDPDELVRIDPVTFEVTDEMPLTGVDRSSPSPVVVASGGGAVFVRVQDQVLQLTEQE